MLRNKLISIAFASFLPLMTFAQAASSPPSEPAKAALIEEMFRLTKAQTLMRQSLEQYIAIFSRSVEKGIADKEAQTGDKTDYLPEIHRYEDKIFELLADRLNWTVMKPKMIVLYDQMFTMQELADIVAFYKSQTGQSALVKLPQLSAKAMQLGQQQVGGASPEIEKMSQDFEVDVEKKHNSAAAGAQK